MADENKDLLEIYDEIEPISAEDSPVAWWAGIKQSLHPIRKLAVRHPHHQLRQKKYSVFQVIQLQSSEIDYHQITHPIY